MMICVECASPVRSLYVYYSADNIHTVKCSKCNHFADKYIEADMMLIFIDLLLLRPAAIRHVVFNSLAQNQGERIGASTAAEPQQPPLKKVGGVSSIVLRLIIFVSLLDVFVQWAMSEKSNSPSVIRFLKFTSPATQYLIFTALCFSDTLLQHVVVRLLARLFFAWDNGGVISISLLIGSFFKLLPILTFIWHYDIPFAEQVIQYVSLFCQTEILSVTLNSNYLKVSVLALASRAMSFALSNLLWEIV